MCLFFEFTNHDLKTTGEVASLMLRCHRNVYTIVQNIFCPTIQQQCRKQPNKTMEIWFMVINSEGAWAENQNTLRKLLNSYQRQHQEMFSCSSHVFTLTHSLISFLSLWSIQWSLLFFLTILSSFCPSVIINCAITRFMAEAEWLDGQVDVGCLGDVELVL